MKICFEKYQGTGNDFIMLDNLNGQYDDISIAEIQQLCDRRFGIGADGLIKINAFPTLDFEVDYYNSDGSKSFCGNGARCAVAFAQTLGIDVQNTCFMAIDGEHSAQKTSDIVALDMNPVDLIKKENANFILHTGSPHYVHFVEDVESSDVVQMGREIRYSEPFKSEGINVNLVEQLAENSIKIRTYERGVEDETLSCGTGATACAIVVGLLSEKIGMNQIEVQVEGGRLIVSYENTGDGKFTNIKLTGPAEFVFKGEINV